MPCAERWRMKERESMHTGKRERFWEREREVVLVHTSEVKVTVCALDMLILHLVLASPWMQDIVEQLPCSSSADRFSKGISVVKIFIFSLYTVIITSY